MWCSRGPLETRWGLQQDFRAVVGSCRERRGNAKGPLGLKLASVESLKPFLSVSIAKGVGKKTVELAEDCHLTNIKIKQRHGMLFLFASVFGATDRSWAAQSPEPEDYKGGSSDLPFADTEFPRA